MLITLTVCDNVYNLLLALDHAWLLKNDVVSIRRVSGRTELVGTVTGECHQGSPAAWFLRNMLLKDHRRSWKRWLFSAGLFLCLLCLWTPMLFSLGSHVRAMCIWQSSTCCILGYAGWSWIHFLTAITTSHLLPLSLLPPFTSVMCFYLDLFLSCRRGITLTGELWDGQYQMYLDCSYKMLSAFCLKLSMT